jgi:hypothetical protein
LLDWITTHVKDDWNRSSRALRRERCSSAAVSKNHRYLAAHQLIGYGPKSVVLAPGGSVFKRDVSTLYISDFIQALAECVKQMREDVWLPAAEKSDDGNCGRLCMRPGGRGHPACKDCENLSPPHRHLPRERTCSGRQ